MNDTQVRAQALRHQLGLCDDRGERETASFDPSGQETVASISLERAAQYPVSVLVSPKLGSRQRLRPARASKVGNR